MSAVEFVIENLMLLVIIFLTWRAFFALIHGRANSRLRELENQLIALHNAIKGTERSWLMRGLLMSLSIATGGMTKIVQIPYDIHRAAGKRKIKAEFKLAQLKAAEIYYVHGEKYGYMGLHKLPSKQPSCCLLLTKPEWKAARKSFINKLKKAMSNGAFVADSTLKLDGVAEKVSEGLFEIPYETIKENLGDKGAKLLGFESLDLLLGGLFESAIDTILF